MTELKLCPFCGIKSGAFVAGGKNTTTRPAGFFEVYCDANGIDACGASGPSAPTEELAIAAWNRRDSGWVSVEERLPDRGRIVQVYGFVNTTDGEPWLPQAYRPDEGPGWHLLSDPTDARDWDVYITHWQPLPEPPE